MLPLTTTIPTMCFQTTTGKHFTLNKEVVAELDQFRQLKGHHKEVGGILLGSILVNNGDYIVDKISVPTASDRRSRFSFYRSSKHHDIALKEWKVSDGRRLYLGLWHTHPEHDPKPSHTDFRDWRSALEKGQYQGDSLFFLIVGVTEIRCWQGSYTEKKALTFKNLYYKSNRGFDL